MDKGKINIDGVSLRLFVTDIKRKFAVTDSANSCLLYTSDAADE